MGVRLSALVTTTLLGLVVGLTSPAHAETHRASDVAGDVQTRNNDFELVLAPEVTDTDIRRSVVRHGKHRVVIKLRLANLTRVTTNDGFQVSAHLKTRRFSWLATLAKEGGWPVAESLANDHGPVRCPGFRATISSLTDAVELSIPRSCLGKPRWIRVGLRVEGFTISSPYYSVDDALRGPIKDYDGPLRMTPKLKRG